MYTMNVHTQVNDIVKDVCEKIEDQLFKNKLPGMLNVNLLDSIL